MEATKNESQLYILDSRFSHFKVWRQEEFTPWFFYWYNLTFKSRNGKSARKCSHLCAICLLSSHGYWDKDRFLCLVLETPAVIILLRVRFGHCVWNFGIIICYRTCMLWSKSFWFDGRFYGRFEINATCSKTDGGIWKETCLYFKSNIKPKKI